MSNPPPAPSFGARFRGDALGPEPIGRELGPETKRQKLGGGFHLGPGLKLGTETRKTPESPTELSWGGVFFKLDPPPKNIYVGFPFAPP